MAARMGPLIYSGQTLHSFCFKAAAAEYGNTGRVGNFRQKNYSAEDEIDGTIGLFRRNSGCSAEQKTLGISIQTIPQRRQMLGIPCHGTKIEANSQNSVLNHSGGQKTLGIPFRTVPKRNNLNSVPWKENSRNSVPKHVSDKKMPSTLFAEPGFLLN
jgi:hypothetical protein